MVFWVLLELCSRRGNEAEGLTTKHTKHTKMGTDAATLINCMPENRLFSFWSYFSVIRVFRGSNNSSSRVLVWMAGIAAVLAVAQTTLHLGVPQLAVSERTLNIARKYLVPPSEKADFEFLAAKPIWTNQPLKTLLQHAHLANYNRTLVNWKLDDQLYREFVLSSEIDPAFDGAMNWRRLLWESFYPRIRKENSIEAAAEIVVRHLRERVTISEGENMSVDVQSIWQRQITTASGFERIYVAALRSAGIPARLAASGQSEFWNGAEWKVASKP